MTDVRDVRLMGRGELIRYAREELGMAIDSHLPIDQIRMQVEYRRAATARTATRPETRRVDATAMSRQAERSELRSESPPAYGRRKMKASMNRSQRTVLLLAALVVLLMLLFPPFHFVLELGTINGGYRFLLDPPIHSAGRYNGIAATVDVAMLVAEWTGAMLIGGPLWWYFGDYDDR